MPKPGSPTRRKSSLPKLIDKYNTDLADLAKQNVFVEMGKLRLTVNPSLTLAPIPPAAFDYRLGNRSALEWVIDQYQVSTDKRSGITSDPNRTDDAEYIVRLVGQVIRVSVETVKIVNGVPEEFTPSSATAS